MLIASALLPGVGARRAAALAIVAGGLAMAGLQAGATPRPPGFLAVDGALFVLAVVLAGVSAVLAGRSDRTAASLVPAGAMVVGAGAVAWRARAVAAAAPVGPLVLAAAVLVAIGAACFLIGRSLCLAPGQDEFSPGPRTAWLGLLAGTLAAAAGSSLPLVAGGVIVAAWSGWVLRRSGGARVPLAPVLTLPLLGAWWLLAVIAGPEGLAVGTLPVLPTSPAAERLLAPVFLLAAWATAGLWPLHRQVPAALLAPVGALLVARVAVAVVPDGLEHWRALMMPVIVLGIWHAAVCGRLASVAVGLAWVGLLGASRGGLAGAALLLAAALVTVLAGHADARGRWWAMGTRAVAALAAGTGGLLAIESGLGAEVVYTVLAAGGIAIAAGHPGPERSDEGALTP